MRKKLTDLILCEHLKSELQLDKLGKSMKLQIKKKIDFFYNWQISNISVGYLLHFICKIVKFELKRVEYKQYFKTIHF